MMWGFYGVAWWWMLLGAICMIIFWGAVIWLVVWGVQQITRNQGRGASPGKTPLEVAQRRLARGEITREEFQEIRDALQH